ncbi:EAL domain-containing protein [Altererythrobacter aestiaquae]|uniref:EAL domain-containing protein n=2 Tax=Pontixanthobacter aestiaquae TaxID=1509367 RepID=A0A844Z9U4_9SPHN|nr:EAL domain-containing protein [Pontixanthobacter aestiaquae]
MGAVLSNALPPWPVGIGTILGVAACFGARTVARKEEDSDERNRTLEIFAWASIAAVMLCTGFNFAYWVVYGSLELTWALAGMVSASALSTSMLTGRIPQQFVAQICCWLPLAVLEGTTTAYFGIAIVTGAMLVVGYHQSLISQRRNELQQARERERNRAEDILRDYEETGQGWFWETDRRGMLTYLSASVMDVLDKPEGEILGRSLTDLFDLGEENREGERTLAFHLSSRSSFQELGVRSAASSEERWWSINGRPAYDSFHNFVGFRGSGTDLTEKKRSEENVNRLAQFDSLTGLANRFQTQQTLQKILSSPLQQQRECAVLLLDLDRFKQVNDTLGHPAGDALLKQVAERLKSTVGKKGQVGRLGGDEFKVITPGGVDRKELGQLAHDIIHSLSQPYSIEGQRVVIGASIGIAIAPHDGVTSESLIRNADLSLYAAKDGGRGRYHFYSNDLHSAAEERAQLEEDLRDAISQGGLELYYQPVIYAHDETIAGFEALLRWNHPTKGWLSPAKFIPVAEDTGLISAIGEWAIRAACDDLATWPENVRCAVNVSPLQFANPQLPTVITNAIAHANIDPSRLELEITESVFLNDDEGTDAMFAALKRVGVRLALDDFGTGYSSLGYLKKAPFDKIKIDQSFVRGATKPGSRNGAIITSITSLAEALGMDTTAEGVETMDELELVRSLGCSHIQGYIYSKALSAEAALARLQQGVNMVAKGPRSARAFRQKMLRKVVLSHGDQMYDGAIRNMAAGGAMVEGLWNVPPGTEFKVAISKKLIVAAKTIWSEDNRMGIQFEKPVDMDSLEMRQVASSSPNEFGNVRKQA